MAGFFAEIGDVFDDFERLGNAFTVALGDALYLNSSGKIVFATLPGKPTYKPTGGMTVDLDSVKKAIDSFGGQLPNLSEDAKSKSEATQFWESLNLDTEWLKCLDQVRAIAETAAAVTGYIGAALSIAKALGILKQGPDPLQTLIEARFEALARSTAALEELIRKHDLRDKRSTLETLTTSVDRYVKSMATATPDAKKLLESLAETVVNLGDAETAIRDLLDPDTWMAQYKPTDYSIRPFQVRTKASPTSVPVWPENGLRFDHRLMVPLVTWGMHTFLLALKTLRPEYRSTMIYAQTLSQLAAKMDVLAERMRSEGLGWMEFTEHDFRPWVLRAPGENNVARDRVLGAIDVCEYTDNFLNVAGVMRGTAPAIKGCLNMRWPYLLHLGHPFNDSMGSPYRDSQGRTLEETNDIANAAALAAVANDQCKRDFGTLLFTSGYLNLVHLAALVRHMSTEPERSETVHALVRMEAIRERDETAIASSENIEFRGVITAQAQLVYQRCEAEIRIHTQPLRQTGQIKYRLVLRTLRFGLAYADYYSTSYETDAVGHPQLRALIEESAELSSKVLMPSRLTPNAAISESGSASLSAATFDVYTVQPPLLPMLLSKDAVKQTGGTSQPADIIAKVRQQSVAMLPRHQRALDFFALDDVRGVARHVADANVAIQWAYTWEQDEMIVSLSTQSADRNYIASLVVEEILPSGTVLQTAVALPVTGAVTVVPESFVNEEQAAKTAASIVKWDVANHLKTNIREPIPPEDPLRLVVNVMDTFNDADLRVFFNKAADVVPRELAASRERVRSHERVKTGDVNVNQITLPGEPGAVPPLKR